MSFEQTAGEIAPVPETIFELTDEETENLEYDENSNDDIGRAKVFATRLHEYLAPYKGEQKRQAIEKFEASYNENGPRHSTGEDNLMLALIYKELALME